MKVELDIGGHETCHYQVEVQFYFYSDKSLTLVESNLFNLVKGLILKEIPNVNSSILTSFMLNRVTIISLNWIEKSDNLWVPVKINSEQLTMQNVMQAHCYKGCTQDTDKILFHWNILLNMSWIYFYIKCLIYMYEWNIHF